MATAAKAERSILIVHDDGTETILENIPGNAKITVGPLSPGRNDYTRNDIALRVYTTVGNQLAVIRNVRSFRDLSLGVKVKQVNTELGEVSETGPKGKRRETYTNTEYEWVPQLVVAPPLQER